MPMLTTFLIGLPVWPLHSPDRTRSQNPLMRSSTSCTSFDDVDTVDDERAALRHAERDVQHRAVLGHVDPLAGEHLLGVLGQS